MIDVDHFKTVNDKYGHHTGDAVLCRIADLLASNLRPQDLIARYGGEEFAVFLPGLDFEPAHAAAERLRQAIESATATDTGNGLPPVTVSIGVASRIDSDTLAAILQRADQSLYGAKQAGRNRIGNR
jgi:diguanylate cyclase (GGDEF)-like protein